MTISEATVLVVDDEPELLEIFSIWLRRNGANVLQAPNGAEALRLIHSEKIDALVSDINMPVMDGVTLVRALRHEQVSIPTVIFVSGFGDVSSRVLYSLGVEATLSKPLGRNQLVQTLAQSLLPREDLWLTPVDAPSAPTLSAEFSSLEDALARGDFALGRGGCCFHAPRAQVDTPVNLHIAFTTDALSIEGQAVVRWYDNKSQQAGVEFSFLDPGSRRWVLQRLRSYPTSSFIPSCAEPSDIVPDAL